MERIVIGGWPALLGEDERFARRWLTDYFRQIVKSASPASAPSAAPGSSARPLPSLRCRRRPTPINSARLGADIASNDRRPPRETVSAYLDALDRLKLTEDSPHGGHA